MIVIRITGKGDAEESKGVYNVNSNVLHFNCL